MDEKKPLLGLPDKDPEWIKEISNYAKAARLELSREDKKFLRELFFEYRRDGLTPKDAIEKAKNVVFCFKN